MAARNNIAVGSMIIIVLAMMAVLVTYDLPVNTFLWIEIQNTGHTPFFGIMALLILAISFRVIGARLRERWHHYLVAFGVATLLGVLTEFAQIIGPRDADIGDLLRDIAGAAAFLGIFMFFDRRIEGGRRSTKRTGILVLAVAVLAISLVPLGLLSMKYLGRNGAFPTICDFDSYWGKRFLSTNDARLKVVAPPDKWPGERGKVGRLTLRPGGYPGLAIMEPYSDWRGYRALSFDLFSPEDTAVNLHIRVEDAHHNDEFSDRFNRTIRITPGDNAISILLSDIKDAPAAREMDLSAIGPVHIFVVDLKRELTLFIDNIRLD